MRVESRARARALQALYAWEMRQAEPESLVEILQELYEHLRVAPQNQLYAEVLLQLVGQNLSRIDRVIQQHLSNWRLSRLSAVDRNVLRLGVGEMLFLDDVSPVETIRAMVQLAEKYGTPESPRFVNGVLDAIMHRIAAERARERGGER